MPHELPVNPKPRESTLDFALQYRPWTVVWYSFRGGVGRTTSLLSTAKLLTTCKQVEYSLNRNDPLLRSPAPRFSSFKLEHPNGPDIDRVESSRPHRIAIIDFDLEAPGVDTFSRLKPDDVSQPGLVEYLDAARNAKESSPTLSNYVYEREWGSSSIVVMRAGRKNEQYKKLRGQLDFESLYRFEHGEFILEELRAGFKKEFNCDILLVDSRTGYTEIGGVCLGHLADACALVFQPTQAHEDGIPDAFNLIRKRSKSEKRPIPIMFLSSKTPRIQKNVFDPESIAQAKAIAEGCGLDGGILMSHDNPQELESGYEEDFVARYHLVFSPLLSSTDLNGPSISPESFLTESVDDEALGDYHQTTHPGIDELREFCCLAKQQVVLEEQFPREF